MAFPQMGAPNSIGASQPQGQLPLARPLAGGPPPPVVAGAVAPGAVPGNTGGIQGGYGGPSGGPSGIAGSLPLASHPLPSLPGQMGGGIIGAVRPVPDPFVPGQLGAGVFHGAPVPQPVPGIPGHFGPASPQHPGIIPTMPGPMGQSVTRRILGSRGR